MSAVGSSDLFAAVLTLEASQRCEVDRFSGRGAHALLLQLLAELDPAATEAAHDRDGITAFTSCAFLDVPRGEGAGLTLRPGDPVRWRITAFEPVLSRLCGLVVDGLAGGGRVELAGAPFRVASVETDARRDPRAGCADFADLLARFGAPGAGVPRRLDVSFETPTTFRRAAKTEAGQRLPDLPLPLPELVFAHWLRKWRACAPAALQDVLPAPQAPPVALSRCRIATQAPLRVHGGLRIGFTGRCTFQVLDGPDAESARRITALLAAFGFWCGTGTGTAMGLGQTSPGGDLVREVVSG